MSLCRLAVPSLLCLFSLVQTLPARNVFVFPTGNSATATTSIFSGDPFGAINSFAGSGSAFQVIAHPTLSKYYVVSRSATDALVIVDGSTYQVTRRYNFTQGVDAAAISPNGSRLLLAAGTLHILETTGDNEVANLVDAGATPNDIAVSIDSGRAYVLSAASQRLSAVDLATNTVLGTSISIPGTSTGVTAAANGLVYVTAPNRVYEIDGRTMTVRAEITLNGQPGKLSVTPDGRYGVTVNRTPVTGSSALIIDLSTRAVTPIPNFNVTLDKLYVGGNNRVFATSAQTQTIYDISLNPATINGIVLGTLGTPTGVTAIALSSELPNPRFLYVGSSTSIYRIDLQNGNQVNGQLAVASAPGAVGYAGPATTGSPTTLLAYNNVQTTPVNTSFLPLVVRALDSTGRPLMNVPVTFSVSDPEVILGFTTTTTNAEGLAQVFATAPNKLGNFSATANAANGAALATFSLTSGTTSSGGSTGTTGGLTIVTGNGQGVREQFVASEPLTVVVRDVNGAPIPNTSVTFTLASGSGDLFQSLNGVCSSVTTGSISCTTDSSGQAAVTFKASNVLPGFSFTTTTINATSGTGSVSFLVTTYLNTFQGGLAADPTTALLAPSDGVVSAKAGQTTSGAVQVRVFATVGPEAGRPIPNIGIKVSTGLDAAAGPTASCSGPGGVALTDVTGTATCDLIAGPRIGTAPLSISVGGFAILPSANLTVTPGAPGVIQILQGNNQTGVAGQQLPLALLAQVQDSFGNPLPGTSVTWEVVTAGSVTLRNIISTADSTGRVSALATLGGSPGAQQVRVRAGSAVGTFTLNVNVTVGSLAVVSGSGQTAEINRAFSQPLTVVLRDNNGAPIPNASVAFAVSSGGATLSAPSATTDAQGQASVTATAGGSAGPIAVTASAGGFNASFSLTARLPGPAFSAAGFRNGASFAPVTAVAPGMILTMTGNGIAPGLNGVVTPGTLVGPLPFTLSNVEVVFNDIYAPIYSVSNVNGQEQVTVQVPQELTPGTNVNITMRVQGGATTLQNVPVVRYLPGIFETTVENRRIAVAQRPDGSFVTPANPARKGERLRFFATSLGQVTGGTSTNRAGLPGQTVIAPFNVGIANAGVPVIGAELLEGVVGVYIVTIDVPADAPSGSDVGLNLGVINPDNSNAFSQRSSLAIQ